MRMRNYIHLFVLCLASAAVLCAAERPNVVVILTDDQGYGDLSVTGNTVLRTPHIDSLARDGAWVKNFYVSPVCSPTRSSLLTGRYNYRTGVVDTYIGRSMMHGDETTLAEMLKGAGYSTGVFGKWHLGDNYPLRSMDQGFDETLVLRGGGIGQPSDPPGGEHYQDPVLLQNGVLKKFEGYCSDVYTDHAMRFIEKNRAKPFFVYLPYNAPHGPLETPEKEWKEYKGKDVLKQPEGGFPVKKVDEDSARKVYAMVANVDANVGRVLKKLDDLALAEKTIVIFLTDNGPQQPRYNAGLRGLKTTVYEGGIRVPFFMRWKGRIAAGMELPQACAHIDVAPTLLDICGIPWPETVKRDGRSFWPLLSNKAVEQTTRSLFFQWHRGDEPEALRAFAVRTSQWKLVQGAGVQEKQPFTAKYELFDIGTDPYEINDLAAQHPEVVARLKAEHEAWHAEMKATRNFSKPAIVIDRDKENPVVLTKQDWRGPRASWGADGLGYWEIDVQTPGDFAITLNFPPRSGKAVVTFGGARGEADLQDGVTTCVIPLSGVVKGITRLEAWVERDGKQTGTKHVYVEHLTR